MDTFLIRLLQLIVSLSILIVIHEFGHFLFAKLYKIRVERFYLFFHPGFSLLRFKKIKGKYEFNFLSKNPPEHWKDYPETTMWGLGWLPLGGYCSIAGMVDETKSLKDLSVEPQAWEFRTRKAGQRLLVMVGGVLFNFVLALALYAAILGIWGNSYLPLQNATLGMEYSEPALKAGFQNGDILLEADGIALEQFNDDSFRKIIEASQVKVLRKGQEVTINIPEEFMQQLLSAKQGFAAFRFPTVVKKVIPGSPGDIAGLLPGDSIVGLNSVITESFTDFTSLLSQYKDSTILLNYYRAGNPGTMQVKLDSTTKIGFELKMPADIYPLKQIDYSFFASIPAGVKLGVGKLTGYAGDMKYVFTKEGARSLGGFGAIGSLFPPSWDWKIFWETTAFLSIILAFMNILPIPGLDGGHIFFLLFEVVSRRKPNEKFMEYAQMAGMLILFALLIYANGNDLFRWLFK
ncbi:MAG: site-2 protease family protein [Bacteroidales bacterium]